MTTIELCPHHQNVERCGAAGCRLRCAETQLALMTEDRDRWRKMSGVNGTLLAAAMLAVQDATEGRDTWVTEAHAVQEFLEDEAIRIGGDVSLANYVAELADRLDRGEHRKRQP